MKTVRLIRTEVENAPKGALIMVTPSLKAIVVERQPDGGVDDPRVEFDSWFYPVSMALEGTGVLEGGDWTVIPYTRANGKEVPTIDGPTVRLILEG